MFSSNATQVVAASTPAEAVDYDSTNDYLSRSTYYNGYVNALTFLKETFTFSCWFYNGESTGNAYVFSSGASSGNADLFYINISTTAFQIRAYDGSGTFILNATTTNTLPLNTFCNLIVSCDMTSTSNRYVYVNDQLMTMTWSNYVNSTIQFGTLIQRVNSLSNSVDPTACRISNVFLDFTYRDLSITANRRLFVTADLKPAAGQAALNPIVYLAMSDPTTVGTNTGTGGNFTLNGTIARSGRGPNQYNAPYSTFDGSADYLSRTTAPTGIADSKQFTFSCVFNANSATNRLLTFAQSTLSRLYIEFASDGSVAFGGYNSAGTNILLGYLGAGTIVFGRNYVFTISVDLANTANRSLYLNGVSQSVVWATYTNDNIDFAITTTPRYYLGASATPASFFNGKIGALWFNTSYIDLSVASNLAKFVSGTGINAAPVDLGATGELPTGTAPLIYLPMYGNNAGKNYGTGGDFTVNSGPYTGARGPNEFWSGAGLFNNPTQTELSALTLNNSPDVTGITKTTFAVCFKRRDVDVTDNSVIFNTTSSTNNNFHFAVYFTDTEVLKVNWNGHTVATSSTITDTNWHTLLVSVDSTATVAQVYLDGVSLTSTITLNRTYTQAYTYVGRATGVSADQCFDGNIGFVYQAHDYIDISQEANRLKFFDAFGYPVDLSAQVTAGAIPAPYIYLLFPESNLGTNNGTAGNFTNNSVTASALVKA